MSEEPLCFVLMPFGRKPDPAGGVQIDFDMIYENALKGGIEDTGVAPLDLDSGGHNHRRRLRRPAGRDPAPADRGGLRRHLRPA
jgi:hypothetical protein